MLIRNPFRDTTEFYLTDISLTLVKTLIALQILKVSTYFVIYAYVRMYRFSFKEFRSYIRLTPVNYGTEFVYS